MATTSLILSSIEGVLRGTVQAGELKRQLQDRKRRQQREDLQVSVAETNLQRSRLQLDALPESLRQGSESRGLRLDALRENVADPFGDKRFESRLRGFQQDTPELGPGELGPAFIPEQGATRFSEADISQALRERLIGKPSPSRQFPFKTPEGQFVATLSPEGEKTNETRLGDLPPTTRSLLGGIDLADFPSLDGGDIVSVQAAIKRILGTRSARDVPTIRRFLGMMAGGATIDDIEDRLLTEQTSPKFTGPIRNTFEFVTRSGLSKDQRDTNRDALDRILETQDVEAGKEFLLAIARDKGTAQERNQVRGRDEALLALDAIEDLILVKTATGPLRGRLQRIQARFTGLAGDERLALLDQEIALAVIDYRQAKSGAAFTESEERLYERIFPSIQNSSKLNLVKVESLRTTFRRNQRAFYIRGLGKRNYLDLFGNEGVPGRETQQQTDSDLEDLFEDMGGNN